MSNRASVCSCRVFACLHMHALMRAYSMQRSGQAKCQSCWCSLSDAEDLLQSVFISDLARGRWRFCVILILREISFFFFLSDINMLFFYCNTFLLAVKKIICTEICCSQSLKITTPSYLCMQTTIPLSRMNENQRKPHWSGVAWILCPRCSPVRPSH